MTRPHLIQAGILGLALICLTTLAYLPGLGGWFLFDDYPQIVHQEAVHLESLDTDSVSRALQSFQHGVGRPLPMLSFALDHWAWGSNAFGYKATSLAVHLANSLLVFLLFRHLFSLAFESPPTRVLQVAALSAAFWALHPLHVSTVLYVVQRMETMSLFFVLLALITYLAGRGRQIHDRRAWPLLLTCIPLVALGIACKESAALFPIYALGIELTLLGFRAASPRTAKAWRYAYGAFIAAALLAAALLLPVYANANIYAIRDYTAIERVLTQFRVLPMYLGWILVPDTGAYLFYYDQYVPSRGLMQPTSTIAGLFFLVVLFLSAILMRKTLPLYSLGIFWFFAAHAITSSYLPLELIFEHRNYFAIVGVVLATYALVTRAWQSPASPKLPTAMALVVLLGLTGLTLLRSSTWGDPLHLAMELAQRNPSSPRAGTGLADQFLLMSSSTVGDPFHDLAQTEYERASAIPGASPIPEQGLLVMAARLGRPVNDDWWQSLVRKLATQPIGPQEMAVVTSLLDLRNDGLPLDDHRLAQAYTVLSRKMTLPAPQYFAFAVHALHTLDDQNLARELITQAVDHADGNERMLREFEKYLHEQGFSDTAHYLQSYAKESKIEVSGP